MSPRSSCWLFRYLSVSLLHSPNWDYESAPYPENAGKLFDGPNASFSRGKMMHHSNRQHCVEALIPKRERQVITNQNLLIKQNIYKYLTAKLKQQDELVLAVFKLFFLPLFLPLLLFQSNGYTYRLQFCKPKGWHSNTSHFRNLVKKSDMN